ncbi:MAG TPA: tetratricopeptide repeat protein [Candidatus Saccharimonadales bacterium]|jgi:tetratricopeptide (TPR) repeat protein|nr:tetratricopeptide repeat protein [Candidatus Saccharimonadales bacterium]
MPHVSSAQSPTPRAVVSVRELSIPPKAVREFQKGIDCLKKEDASGSLPHFEQAIANFGNYYEAYFEIGIADLKLSRIADAEQALRKSVEMSAGHYADPLFALGGLLIQQNKFSEGEKVLREALDLNPTSWAGNYCLGWALFGLNRFQEAEKSVREAIRWKADSADSYLLLAEIHGHLHDYSTLLQDLDAYVKLEPNGPMNDKVRSMRDKAEQGILESQNTAASLQPGL